MYVCMYHVFMYISMYVMFLLASHALHLLCVLYNTEVLLIIELTSWNNYSHFNDI